jgi:hypothetical protein
MAVARLFCGPLTLLVYIPLAAMLFRKTRSSSRTGAVVAVCEEISQ